MIEFKLFRRGRTHLPIYEIVVAEKRKKNGGKFIAKAGVYDPRNLENSFLREDVVRKWLSYGAGMTTKVHDLISKAGIFKRLNKKEEASSQPIHLMIPTNQKPKQKRKPPQSKTRTKKK